MFQIQDHSLRPVATAHLAQTMSLLELGNLELRERVLEELSTNPALELVEERVCPLCQRRLPGPGPCPRCIQSSLDEEAIVFVSPRDSYRKPIRRGGHDEMPELEPAAPESLAIHVLQQLAAELDPEDRPLAVYILSSLDEDGFLQEPLPYLVRTTRAPMEQLQSVLEAISHVDPPGLATPGPRKALLAQLDMLPSDDPTVSLAKRMLEETFQLMGQKDYAQIAKHLKISQKTVRQTLAFIQENLNPYPARAFWGSGRGPQSGDPNVYHSPDILITQRAEDAESPLMVEIFSAMRGWLRVNPLLKKALKDQAEGPQSEEWKEHLERASLFVKCLQQRNNTMRQLMQLLVNEQRRFILEGDRHLKPMTRAELAEEIGVHESTISRAVSSKSIALPDGRIIPLAKFFDRSLSVRDRIKEIVKKETTPLTDAQIASELHDQGVDIARRTVAKYRSIEGILPARLRKREKVAA